MSKHVYVANEGLKDNPISQASWLAAARQHPALLVQEHRNRKTGALHHSVLLKDDKKTWLELDPYGLVHAQDPSRRTIDIMFELADTLNAGVYNEKAKLYSSPEDWEKRTRQYREQRAARVGEHRRASRRRKLLWTVYFVVVVGAGIFSLLKVFA